MVNAALRVPGQTAMFPGAVVTNGFVFTSGLVSADCLRAAADGGPVPPFSDQARQAVDELARTLAAADSGLDSVVTLTSYLADAADFGAWNEIFASAWPDSRPARTTVTVGFAAPGIRIELAAMAVIP